uniref:TIL domain-containing protein n=1 Tax=Panagrolaimus sp. PS1159 TaxID=55785 RepID=A0AC35FS25_9BILA
MTKLLIACFAIICLTLIITQNSDAFPAVNNGDGLTPDDCRKDEDFLQCGTCPKTCKDPNPKCDSKCKAPMCQCKAGTPKCDSKCKAPMCQCKAGTVRATDGSCIKPEECPPTVAA